MENGQRSHRWRHLFLLLAVALAVAVWITPPFVQSAQDYNRRVAASALGAYAVLRTINAAISTAKEVEVSVPLVGGIGGKPGMALDPVDETVARISDGLFLVMSLTAILALTFAPVAKVGAALAAAGFLGLWCAATVPRLCAVAPAARAAATAGTMLAIVLPAAFAGGGWLGEVATERTLEQARTTLDSAGGNAVPQADEGRGWWPFGENSAPAADSETSRSWLDDYQERAVKILESSLTILAVYALRLVVLPAMILALVFAVLRGALRSAASRRG